MFTALVNVLLPISGLCALKDRSHTLDLEVKDSMCRARGSHSAGILEMAPGSHSGSSLSQALCILIVPNRKKAHMFIHLHLIYCCLSLSLGSGRVVRRRKVPSWKQ